MCTDTLINGRWELKLPEHRKAFWDRGDWERERLEHMHSTTRPGDRVIYIGAEEGDMPALLAWWGAELFLVEPGERVWPNMKAIWEANDLPTPAGCFVGFAGETDSYNWVNGWSLAEWPECAYGPVITDHAFPWLGSAGYTPITCIDGISQSFPPNMISIDVEGSEWHVLKGAIQTLTINRPRIYLSLHPEFLFHQDNRYGTDVRNMIKAHNYREELIAYPAHECHFYYEPL